MKGERPQAPRCPVCGKYMEAVRAFNGGVTYECCDVSKSVPSPSQRLGIHDF